MSGKSDHDLISEIQAGKREALGELFDRHSPALFDFIYQLVGDRDQAARLLEQVFTHIPSVASQVDGRIPVRGWLYGVAREFALTSLRQREWLDALPSSDEPSGSSLVGDLWRAARLMPAFHRAVLVVEELHGLSPAEKARALGVMRTDLPRWLEDARRSFDNQYDQQARQHGRPLSTQIDPERIWGMRRRIGATGSLFGYLPAMVLPDALAEMIRRTVLKSAQVGAAASAPLPSPTPEVPREIPPPFESRPSEPVAAQSEGCAWRLVGIALAVALVVTALVVIVGYVFTRDTVAPVISNKLEPAADAFIPANPMPGSLTTRVTIAATYSDNQGVDVRSVRLIVDGRDVAAQAKVSESSLSYGADLSPGRHVILIEVRDTAGNVVSRPWQFTVGTPPAAPATATLPPTVTLAPSKTRTPAPPGTVARTTITRGTPVLISWQVPNAEPVFLNQEPVDPCSRRLTAASPGGTAERSITSSVEGMPDLIITDVGLSPNNQIMYTIRNAGTAGVTRPFLIQVTANHLVVFSECPVATLPAGQEAKRVVPNRTVLGTQTITVRVNLPPDVPESNCANNEKTLTLTGPTETPTSTMTPTHTPTFTPTATPVPLAGAGSQTGTDEWASAPTGSGWQRVRILAPDDLTLNLAAFANN